MVVGPEVERKEFEATSDRVFKSENFNSFLAPPRSPFDIKARDGERVQFAVTLAITGTIASPIFAGNGRHGTALAIFVAPWAFAISEWRTRVVSKSYQLPVKAARGCQLLQPADYDCVHCLSIPVRQLKAALAPQVAPGGGEDPKLDDANLERILDAVLPSAQAATYVDKGQNRSAVLAAVVSEFGAERRVRAPSAAFSAPNATNGVNEEHLWLGVAAKPPAWAGDEQVVQLCIGMPGGSKQATWASSIVMPIIARVAADDLERAPA